MENKIKHFDAFVIKKDTAVLTAYTAEGINGQAFAEGILRTDKDDIALFQFGIALAAQKVIDIHEALIKVRISSLLCKLAVYAAVF
ncbi:hypothetical protein [Treponema socranskii]